MDGSFTATHRAKFDDGKVLTIMEYMSGKIGLPFGYFSMTTQGFNCL